MNSFLLLWHENGMGLTCSLVDSRLSDADRRLLWVFAYQLKHKFAGEAYKDLEHTYLTPLTLEESVS